MKTRRVLLLADDGYGANWLIEDGKPSIQSCLEGFGWVVESASPKGVVEPCAWAAARGFGSRATTHRCGDLVDPLAWDAVVVLPGTGHEGLLRDQSALALLRGVAGAGRVVGAFCRAVRVLAVAGVIGGRRVTGHHAYAADYAAAGATYVGYRDREGKTDAPLPLIDGPVVTGTRSNRHRVETCEALRLAVEAHHAGNAGRAPAEGRPGAERRLAIAYCSHAHGGIPSTDLLLLAESLRRFGGSRRDSPLRLYVPRGESLPAETLGRAARLGLGIGDYAGEPSLAAIPFAEKALAAAAAEEEAAGEGGLLLWLDRDSLVLGGLDSLDLPEPFALGYRPVNVRNIGSPADEPPDPFWARAFELGGLDPEGVGRIRAWLGGEELRFYISAGLLVVDPGRGILRRWAEFTRLFAADRLLSSLAAGNRGLGIFLHQAALSVAAASLVPPHERVELPPEWMFPLNLWDRAGEGRRPAVLEALKSLRYDDAFEGGGWRRFPAGPTLGPWLEERLGGAAP